MARFENGIPVIPKRTCPTCRGTGEAENDEDCPTCFGSGSIEEMEDEDPDFGMDEE